MTLINLTQIKDGMALKETVDKLVERDMYLQLDSISNPSTLTFNLTRKPVNDMPVKVILNGLVYTEFDGLFNVDYTNKTVTWLDTTFEIDNTWSVNVEYYTTDE